MKFGLAKLAFDAPKLPDAPTIENTLKVPDVTPNDVPVIGTTPGVINGATMKPVKPPALPKVAAEQEVAEEQEENKKPLLTVPGVLAGIGAGEIGKRLGAAAGDTLGYEWGDDAGIRKLERYIAEHPELSPDDKESIRYRSSTEKDALKGQRIGKRAGKIIGGAGLGAIGITLGNMYSNRNKEATTMNYELAKIARDYSRDPIWKLLNDDRDASEAAYEEALAARNPEILDKQHQAYATGAAIGSGVGGTVGGLGGAVAGFSQPGPPLPRLVAGGVGGLTGAVAGGLGGALAGLVAAAPVSWMHGLKEDPEVRRRVSETSNHHAEAVARKVHYEQNDPIFGARPAPVQEREAAEHDFGFSKLAAQYEELMNAANQADQNYNAYEGPHDGEEWSRLYEDRERTDADFHHYTANNQSSSNAPIYAGLGLGAGVGGALGAWKGKRGGLTEFFPRKGQVQDLLGKAERVVNGTQGALAGAVAGGLVGTGVKEMKERRQESPELAHNEDYYGPEKEASELRHQLEKVANDYAKIASDHLNDPEWNRLNDDLSGKSEALIAAQATRNPDLIRKEKLVDNIGMGGGALIGGLGAGALGVDKIVRSKGISKLLPSILTPTVGVPLGVLAGGITGAAAVSPISNHIRRQEDPEVRENVEQASNQYHDADNRLYSYELENDYDSYGY